VSARAAKAARAFPLSGPSLKPPGSRQARDIGAGPMRQIEATGRRRSPLKTQCPAPVDGRKLRAAGGRLALAMPSGRGCRRATSARTSAIARPRPGPGRLTRLAMILTPKAPGPPKTRERRPGAAFGIEEGLLASLRIRTQGLNTGGFDVVCDLKVEDRRVGPIRSRDR